MRFLALLIVGLLGALPVRAADLDQTGLDHADLTVTTAAGQAFHFDVEVAKTEAQQQRGLMFRKSLAPDAGMIFPYERDTMATFYMKNCYISLDMLFVAGDSRITHIMADAKPLFDAQPREQDLIPSGGPIRLVVEINGGTAAKLGIHVGDKVVVAAKP